ncbi:hypothetical protein MFIFM68171_00850 [Madurella fahalii]|uniref:Uncharacterized protein n=1 Tax=Madurella fahalii TaxID=1157608 RepID=A0ABQ0FYQ1_9PEZI
MKSYITVAVLALAGQTALALPSNVARATPNCGALTDFCIRTRGCTCDFVPQISCPNPPDFTCNLACTCS